MDQRSGKHVLESGGREGLAGHGKAHRQDPENASESSEDAGSGAGGSQASGSEAESGRSSSRSSSRGPAGSEVVVQSGEAVDLPPFNSKLEKPMMEMVAGSNVWFQATVLQSRKDKLRVLFPATSESKRDKTEWVLQTSSRIWRGSMSSREWKYLSKGAWAPRTTAKGRARSKKGACGGSGARSSHANATGSGTPGAAASAGSAGRGGVGVGGEEPDVASPRKRRQAHYSEERDAKRARSGAAAGAGRAPTSKDPLVNWFTHHFALLDKAGK